MKDTERQAINNLNNLLQTIAPFSTLGQQIKSNVDILANGLNSLDQEVKQKTFEVLNREQLLAQRDNLLAQKDQILVQKDQKVGELQKTVFVDSLHKLYPDSYPAKVEQWPDTLPMKKHVVNNNVLAMETNTKLYKEWLVKKEQEDIKKEFIKNLHELYPDTYPANFGEWTDKLPMRKHVVDNNFQVMEKNNNIYKGWLAEKQAKELEEAKKLKEENLEKEQLLAQKDQLLGNKDNVLSDKDKEIETLNQLILAEKVKIEELLVEKANEQQKLIDKVSDQTENIERINILLETKEIIIQRLEQEKEILQTRHDILDMKMQLTVKEFTVREREKDKALIEKDNELKKLAESSKLLADSQEEMLKFKELCETKEAEIKEKDELLVQKEIEKAVLVDDLQEKLHFKDSEILGLKMMVSEMDLAGDYQLEHLND
jgi:hypothetical protein